MNPPLEGIKVVEVSVAMAGPFCGMLLADYGADVVKVERVGSGDDSRLWPPHFHNKMSYYFAAANRGKRDLAVDLKNPEGMDIVRRLIANADVLIDNYRVGALDRLGLGYDAMSELNPRLVYCSISGFGRDGPRREDRANDLFMQAYSGGMSITGEKDGPPAKMGISIADTGAGLFAAVGVLMALESRHRTGRGQYVNTSLLEGQLAMLSYHLTYYFATGRPPLRQGSGSQLGVPYQAFPTADDWLVVAIFNARMWRDLCEALGRLQWVEDSRFATSELRQANRELLVALLSDLFRTMPAKHWEGLLHKAGVPCTQVNRIDQIVEEPQVRENGMIVDFDVPQVGPIRMAGLPLKFSETPGRLTLPPPRLGEHSREILQELGFGEPDIGRLVAQRVIGVAPP
jgi:crotonobetainyl-CoA:carnitine CoA-transferase CaiB-like acyl-CoA transferase